MRELTEAPADWSDQALDAIAARAREHEERRATRGRTDVNYGADESQVPAEGWVT